MHHHTIWQCAQPKSSIPFGVYLSLLFVSHCSSNRTGTTFSNIYRYAFIAIYRVFCTFLWIKFACSAFYWQFERNGNYTCTTIYFYRLQINSHSIVSGWSDNTAKIKNTPFRLPLLFKKIELWQWNGYKIRVTGKMANNRMHRKGIDYLNKQTCSHVVMLVSVLYPISIQYQLNS